MVWLPDMAMRRKVLITEIAGVLNTSQSSCDETRFDTEAIDQLKRIVDATGCVVVLSPTRERKTGIITSATTNALANLLGAVLRTEVYTLYSLEDVLEYLGKGQPESFCVLKYHDGVNREWLGTFGIRYMYCGTREEERDANGKSTHRMSFRAGLTEDIARGVILMLDNLVEAKDIPLKVFAAAERGISRIKELQQQIRSDPNQRDTKSLEYTYREYLGRGNQVKFPMFYLVLNRYRDENGQVFDWAIKALKKVAEEMGKPFNPIEIQKLFP